MEIVAKTKGGVLISATTSEVAAIVNAVTGEKPKEINIGLKLPAIDYASTIRKIKELSNNYSFNQVIEHTNDFKRYLDELVRIVKETKEINL